MTKIRHKNVVKLHGFCLHNRSMFLIYEYLERGSLFCILVNDVEAVELDWIKRVNVIKSVSHALAYLHHDCKPPIVIRAYQVDGLQARIGIKEWSNKR